MHLVLLSALLLDAAPTLDAGKVIDQTIAAHGGREALEKATYIHVTGVVRSSRLSEQPGSFIRLFRGHNQLGVANMFPGRDKEVRYLRGDRGWHQGVEVTGLPLLGMQLQAARMAMPLSLAQQREAVVRHDDVTRDGKTYYVLELPVHASLTMRVEIDAKSGLIERSIGIIRQGPHTVDFVTTYADYRTVQGVRFPFAEERTIMGRHAASVRIDAIQVLAEDPGESL